MNAESTNALNKRVGHSLPSLLNRNEMRPNWRKNGNNNRMSSKNQNRQWYSDTTQSINALNKKSQQETLFIANLPPVANDEELEELRKELSTYLTQFCTVEKLQIRHGRPGFNDADSDIRMPIAFALLSNGDTVQNVVKSAVTAPFRQSYHLRLETAWNQRQVRVKFTEKSLNLNFFRQSMPWSQEPQKFILLFGNRPIINWKLIREICSVFGHIKVVLARQSLHPASYTYLFDVDFERSEDCLLAFQTLDSFQHRSGMRVQMRGHFFDEYRPNQSYNRSVQPTTDTVQYNSPNSALPSMGLVELQSENGQDFVSNSQSPTTPKNDVTQFTVLNTPSGAQSGGPLPPIKPRLTLQTLFNREAEQLQSSQSQVPMLQWNNPVMNRNHAGLVHTNPSSQQMQAPPLMNMNAFPLMPAHLVHPHQGVYMGSMMQTINGTYQQIPLAPGMPLHLVPYQLPMNLYAPSTNQQTQSENVSPQQEKMGSEMNLPQFPSSTSMVMCDANGFLIPSGGEMRHGIMPSNMNGLGLQDQGSFENEGQIHIPAWQGADSYY